MPALWPIPSTVVQDITHSQLLGYTYQATTFDPAPPPSSPANKHGQATILKSSPRSPTHVYHWPLLTFPPRFPCGFRGLVAHLLRHASHRGPGGSEQCWISPQIHSRMPEMVGDSFCADSAKAQRFGWWDNSKAPANLILKGQCVVLTKTSKLRNIYLSITEQTSWSQRKIRSQNTVWS